MDWMPQIYFVIPQSKVLERAISHSFQQQQIQQPIRFSKALLDYAICMIIGWLYGILKGEVYKRKWIAAFVLRG